MGPDSCTVFVFDCSKPRGGGPQLSSANKRYLDHLNGILSRIVHHEKQFQPAVITLAQPAVLGGVVDMVPLLTAARLPRLQHVDRSPPQFVTSGWTFLADAVKAAERWAVAAGGGGGLPCKIRIVASVLLLGLADDAPAGADGQRAFEEFLCAVTAVSAAAAAHVTIDITLVEVVDVSQQALDSAKGRVFTGCIEQLRTLAAEEGGGATGGSGAGRGRFSFQLVPNEAAGAGGVMRGWLQSLALPKALVLPLPGSEGEFDRLDIKVEVEPETTCPLHLPAATAEDLGAGGGRLAWHSGLEVSERVGEQASEGV